MVFTTTIYDSEMISAPLPGMSYLSECNFVLIQSGDQNASVVLGSVPKSLVPAHDRGQDNGATVNNRSFTFHFLRR